MFGNDRWSRVQVDGVEDMMIINLNIVEKRVI